MIRRVVPNSLCMASKGRPKHRATSVRQYELLHVSPVDGGFPLLQLPTQVLGETSDTSDLNTLLLVQAAAREGAHLYRHDRSFPPR